ncbi:MAG: hypothetical protein O3B09_00365, partial [Proteobacteria bacterium]|nr:hypothetical protein [Pseudomonadota bacterium]
MFGFAGEAWEMIKNNKKRLSIITAMCVVVILPIQAFLGKISGTYHPEGSTEILAQEPMTWTEILSSLSMGFLSLFIALAYLMAIVLLKSDSEGGFGHDYKVKFKERFLALVWANIIKFILIILGCIFFIIPGLILAFRFIMIDYFVIFHKNNFSQAAKNSAAAVKGYKYAIFEFGVILGAVFLIFFNVALFLIFGQNSIYYIVLSTVLSVFVNMLYVLTIYKLWQFRVKEISETPNTSV